MFKKLKAMYAQENAAITSEEIAFVETLLRKKGHGFDTSIHRDALVGSRRVAWSLSVAYHSIDAERSYLWATIALPAGTPRANELMKTVQNAVPADRRFSLEILARKWYTLHKGDFAARKAAFALDVQSARAMGIRLDADAW